MSRYYHAPTGKIYKAIIVRWEIDGLTSTGGVLYTPVVEVEIDGVLSTITVEYPSSIIKQKGME